MGYPKYNLEQRQAAIKKFDDLCASGKSVRDAIKECGVSDRSIYNWKKDKKIADSGLQVKIVDHGPVKPWSNLTAKKRRPGAGRPRIKFYDSSGQVVRKEDSIESVISALIEDLQHCTKRAYKLYGHILKK
jgi:hypothetical protein